MVTDFGLNAIVLKLFSRRTNQKKTIAELLGLRISASLVLIGLILILMLFLPYNSLENKGFSPVVKLATIILSFTIISQSIGLSANSFFQHHLKYKQTFIATLSGGLFGLIAVVVITAFKQHLISLVVGFVLGSFGMALVSYFLLTREVGFLTPIFNLKSWRFLVIRSWPVGVALVLNLIYFRVDSIIIAFVRPVNEVAFYGLAYKVFETALVLPIFFINAIYPVLLKLVKSNWQRFVQTCWVALFILLAGGIVTTILFWFGAGFLVRLAGGREFAEATLALKILSLGFVLFYLSALTMWLLVVFDKQFWLIVVYGVGSVFNLLINLALIPTFGYLAAAVTTGLSELVIFVMSALLVVRFFRSLFRINNKW